ncbi:hypothetical protein Tco_0631710 [Tanacetum coccineum]
MRFNTRCKESEQMKKDFKISQDKDIDKLIALENQVKFLNDIAYKTNQSVQTIHMLAPNPSLTYNEQHCIELELALQHEKENIVCENSWAKQPFTSWNNENPLKEKNDSLIAELNRKTLEISDLKAQLQDKTIANAEMHESWNKIKGKGVNTNFGKTSILGKPPLQPFKN